MSSVRSVVVLGGGSAGLLAALTLKVRLPSLKVRLIRSSEISTIGVGEGSTVDLPNHLHGFCRLDPARFHVEAKPTWKLGVRFLWGPRPDFVYTFTYQVCGIVEGLPKARGYYCWEDFTNADLNSALMGAGRAFVRQPNGVPEIQNNVAYHIENADLIAYLERAAAECGVEIMEGIMGRVLRDEQCVQALELESGERVEADLFIDASGFRSELLGRAMDEPFDGFADSLFCDRAVVGGWNREDEQVRPYTTAETMEAGWAWQIEHERHINRGYVYCSAFISDDAAEAEFRRKNPKIQSARIVPFRPGRYRRSWVGNVIAVGNAAGFVEPLEATALMVICQQARFLCHILSDTDLQPGSSARGSYNRMVTRIWDEIRDFLAIHYRYNTRIDSPFWQHCRRETALYGAQRIVEFYQEQGPSMVAQADLLPSECSVFQLEGFYTLLLGQKVPFRKTRQPSEAEIALWDEYRRENEARARSGLTVAESLEYVRHPGWRWTPGFYPNAA
jgi:tryptophan halogenase